MVYLLKFGASWVLPPGIFIVALFILSIYLWRQGQSTRKAAAVLFVITFVFYLFCTMLTAERTMGWLEGKYTPPEHPQGDVIVMLGGGAYPDTPDVDGMGTLCSSPANRILTAVRLQRELNVPILVSGGQVYGDTGEEAKIAKRVLMSLGVPEDMILAETKSINTTQNAKYSAELMREYGLNQPILVTSAYHMNRAMLNFHKQGLNAEAFPSDYQVPRHPEFHYTKLRPQTEALLDNVTVLQETLRTFVTRYLE